jgi:heme/copper-type cytochrome/quinol oxidase subunit 2
VLPGRYTETWFEATMPGRYQIMCAEYCGTWHSQMWGEVVVMPGPEFDAWMVEQKAGLAERVDTGRRRRRRHARFDRRVRQEDRDDRKVASAAIRSTASRTSVPPGWTSTSGARRWRAARP